MERPREFDMILTQFYWVVKTDDRVHGNSMWFLRIITEEQN